MKKVCWLPRKNIHFFSACVLYTDTKRAVNYVIMTSTKRFRQKGTSTVPHKCITEQSSMIRCILLELWLLQDCLIKYLRDYN